MTQTDLAYTVIVGQGLIFFVCIIFSHYKEGSINKGLFVRLGYCLLIGVVSSLGVVGVLVLLVELISVLSGFAT